MTFKAGDKVKCVDNGSYESLLEVGRIYEVVDSNRDFTTIKYNSCSQTYSFYHFRFELVEEKPMEFKVGDRVACVNNDGVESLINVGDCGVVIGRGVCGYTLKKGDGNIIFLQNSRLELENEYKSYLGCLNVYPDKQNLSGGSFQLTSEYKKDDVVFTVNSTGASVNIPENSVRLLIKHLEEWLKNRRFDF